MHKKISGFSAFLVERQRLHCSCIHDRDTSDKKYGSHSALNMFTEYSMTDPGELAEFFGFTEEEVKGLCEEYAMNFEEVKGVV